MGLDIFICARHYFSDLVPISAFVERDLPFSLFVMFWANVDFCEDSFMIGGSSQYFVSVDKGHIVDTYEAKYIITSGRFLHDL